MKDSKLTLLQYNVQKGQSVQELLLATSALQEVDIIALQELWKNPHLCYNPGDGSHLFIGNQAVGQARGHHGSQVTNQQGVT